MSKRPMRSPASRTDSARKLMRELRLALTGNRNFSDQFVEAQVDLKRVKKIWIIF